MIRVAIRNTLMTSSFNTSPSVACLIIGDEVLNGKTLDTNSNYLARTCFDSGLSLKRTIVIPDVKEDIIKNVQSLSKEYDFVFTSGGIGPTHDDITYSSIAEAFSLKLAYHEPTMSAMQRIGLQMLDQSKIPKPYELTESRKRMALLPYSTDTDLVKVLFPVKTLWVPIVIVNKNVHILPGVPKLFKDLISHYFTDILLPTLPNAKKFIRKLIGTSMLESDIADTLTQIQSEADQYNIQIGSYPKWRPAGLTFDEWKLKVVVSILGKDQDKVDYFAKLVKDKVNGFETQDLEFDKTQKL